MTAEETERITGQPWGEGNPQWEKMHAHYYKQGIDIRTADDDTSVVVAEQVSLTERGYIYTQRELIEKARYLYPSKQYKIIPLTYQLSATPATASYTAKYPLAPRRDTKPASVPRLPASSLASSIGRSNKYDKDK